ncbi:FtsX-like permease family protein [Candidatus Woesearchaeota archaeon]|nr:FtsX-like permease family protein [Candidatus Woesearchaeota archaeon]
MIKDILKYAVSNIFDRKLRSFLSVLSILIGITAIFALSSFGLGMQYFVEDFAKQMGTDKLMVLPKDYVTALGETNVEFDDDDINFINKVKGVDEATGMIFGNAKVEFKDYKPTYPYVAGISTEPEELRIVEEMFASVEMDKGRDLEQGDVLDVVLGYNYQVPDRIFKRGVKVGDKITVNGVDVDVKGFYEEVGNPEDDRNVYISLEGAREVLQKENYFYIIARTLPGENPSQLAEKVEEKFRKHRDLKEGQEDFLVQTFEQVMETYTNVLNILVGILILIALVSLVVAAVNITNTMYTSILERTQEVGVMKSIGARNKFILFIFMTEAGILGFFGGILGITLGYAIAKAGGLIASYYGLSMLQPHFPLWLIIGSLLFSFFVGAGSGTLPAFRASRLNPVDALRYE